MPPSSGSEENPSPRKLSPFVFWAQTENNISLRVSLQDVSEPEINTDANSIEFSAHGIGANAGRNEYYFKFVFFKEIDPKVQISMKQMAIEILIEKKDLEWWPRLTKNPEKLAWLKLDFNKLKTFDDEDEEEAYDPRLYDPADTLSKIKSRKRKYQQRVEDFRKIYLFLYNLSQFIGFLYVLIVLTIEYAKEGPQFLEKAYPLVQTAFTFCQVLQMLEVIHPMLGYTAGSAFAPFLQVFGRMFMLVGMINAEPRIQSKPAVFYLIYVYCISEVIRYPYYMLRVYNVDIGFLTWLRYTVWIALYPLGFLCEGIIILRNIPYFEETQKYSLFLPNKWNISFYFPSILRLYLLLGLFPLLYFAMTHMYRQRVKILGRSQHRKED
ncbi:very-long-chain (3R)-3-hydroxyacyl-CoA dehydratase-like [Argiope bruennichi]|uniref:very-long-chain (3R)-3-hydroxyacyl-CoA dehydratase-like n=1 Tax=Argiope bruennichi TaxID=94029 RepID=UPI0024944E0F|nr:very-long-chain (3R)-3-hydroxyacyl-CoA dehydratase-like [Argiope bruennichi]